MSGQIIISILLTSIILSQQAPTLDIKLAEEIFSYSRPSYCNKDKLELWTCPPCLTHPNMQELQVFYNDTHAAQGYCGFDADNNRVIIAIRGTDDNKNWAQDANWFLESYRCDGCKVHQGFHNVYEDIANNLLACAYVLTSNHPNAEVVVTGHSLGAAQSTLAAIEIQEEVARVDHFYNYGTPRVGNKAFVNYIEKTLAHTYLGRVVHWQDLFVHFGTQSMGFEHYGKEIFYNSDSSSYIECNAEDKKCSDQFFWPWQWNINDHLHYFGQYAGCEDQ